MTEAQAKKKWCPMVNRAGDYGNANADGGNRTTFCIGSACMMWRWELSPRHIALAEANGATKGRETPTGYCGLAGRP